MFFSERGHANLGFFGIGRAWEAPADQLVVEVGAGWVFCSFVELGHLEVLLSLLHGDADQLAR